MQTQPTLAVANYLIGKAQSEGRPITPMQLIKLIYIAHGWTLGLYNQPLIGEQVEAWTYGPVIPSAYHDFKHYGRDPITQQKAVMSAQGEWFIPTVSHPLAAQILDKVWAAYRHLDGIQLSSITHQPGTPWYKQWHDNFGRFKDFCDNVLLPSDIADYYKALSDQNR